MFLKKIVTYEVVLTPFRGRFYIFLRHLGVDFDTRDYAI